MLWSLTHSRCAMTFGVDSLVAMCEKLRVQLAAVNRYATMTSVATSSESALATLHAAVLLRVELLLPLLPTSRSRHTCKPKDCVCGYERLVGTCIEVCVAAQARVAAAVADEQLLALCVGCLRLLTEGVMLDDPRLLPLLDGAWRSRAVLPPSALPPDLGSLVAFHGAHCVRPAVACTALCPPSSGVTSGAAAGVAGASSASGGVQSSAVLGGGVAVGGASASMSQSWSLLEGLIDVRNLKSATLIKRAAPRYAPLLPSSSSSSSSTTTTTVTAVVAATMPTSVSTQSLVSLSASASRKRQPPPPDDSQQQQQFKRHQSFAAQFVERN